MTHGTGQALAAAVVSSAGPGARWSPGQLAEIKATTVGTGAAPATG